MGELLSDGIHAGLSDRRSGESSHLGVWTHGNAESPAGENDYFGGTEGVRMNQIINAILALRKWSIEVSGSPPDPILEITVSHNFYRYLMHEIATVRGGAPNSFFLDYKQNDMTICGIKIKEGDV